jgi:formate-dependent nitrite reductase cytochrome c552 subunit
MALTGESPVARACSDGGLRGAMELMQTFVKRAKAEGMTFVCTDCHVEEDDYSRLAPNADAEFRKLLFLARPD